jgi:hypothetical protein
MKLIFAVLMIFLPLVSSAQHNRNKNKDSKAKGTLFGYWGYNRSAYTKSNINFVGVDYDFTLDGVKASDNPSVITGSQYLKLSNLTVPQFNARIGYYFKNHWAISFGYDHMKYVMDDANEVFLSGNLGPSVDPVTGWSGDYAAEPVVTNRNFFHYENSDGMNYLRLELTRTDHLAEFGNNDQFVLSSNLGIAAGGILSFNDFRFGGDYDMRTISMSGYGASLHANLRAEFLRHFFVQTGFSGGFMHQVRVKTRPNNSQTFARHAFGYGDWNTVIGFLFYIRPKNGCDSCPVW